MGPVVKELHDALLLHCFYNVDNLQPQSVMDYTIKRLCLRHRKKSTEDAARCSALLRSIDLDPLKAVSLLDDKARVHLIRNALRVKGGEAVRKALAHELELEASPNGMKKQGKAKVFQ